MTEVRQCAWAARSPEEQLYHDTEWGVPTHEDSILFEFLILETMQAGLSWTLVLKRREAMREAFDGFDINTLAAYTPVKEAKLLENPNIIRNRLKIASLRKMLWLLSKSRLSSVLLMLILGRTPMERA